MAVQAFKLFDTKGRGFLSYDQMKKAIDTRWLQPGLTLALLRQIFLARQTLFDPRAETWSDEDFAEQQLMEQIDLDDDSSITEEEVCIHTCIHEEIRMKYIYIGINPGAPVPHVPFLTGRLAYNRSPRTRVCVCFHHPSVKHLRVGASTWLNMAVCEVPVAIVARRGVLVDGQAL